MCVCVCVCVFKKEQIITISAVGTSLNFYLEVRTKSSQKKIDVGWLRQNVTLGRLRCQHCRKGWPLSEMKVSWASREWLQDSHGK